MMPITSQNSFVDLNPAPFLPYWRNLLEGGLMGDKQLANAPIEAIKITRRGKQVVVYRLEMAAHTESKRLRIRWTFDTRAEADKAYLAELGRRNPFTKHIYEIPPELLSIVYDKYKLLEKGMAELPAEHQKPFDWADQLGSVIDEHIFVCTPVTLRQLVDKVIEEQLAESKKPDKSDKKGYITTIKWAMRCLFDDELNRFPEETNIKTIKPVILNDLFLGYRQQFKGSTLTTLHTNITSMFNRAVALEWLRRNPMHSVKRPRKGKVSIIIHNWAQAEAILTTAWDYAPDMLPHCFFGYFYGLSPCEIGKMPWENFVPKDANVVVDDTMTKLTRTVLTRDIVLFNPKQIAWVAPFKGLTGPVRIVDDYSSTLQQIRLTAARDFGIEIPQWFGPIMRRTWMSHLYHTGTATEQVKRDGGHAKASDTAFKSYIAYVSKPDAFRFFKLMPPNRPPGTKRFSKK